MLALLLSIPSGRAAASIAYGSINNFDTVNDTGRPCHGFEIELEDCRSTDISYTYNYNHYGVPSITQDEPTPGHPRCVIRWASSRKPDGSWAAFTAVPSGPIAPTDGHQFTNPSVNFGGEHFGVGYLTPPSAIRYHWLVDDGTGRLVNGGDVQVATPTFTWQPPAAGAPAVVQAVIRPPEPPEVHPLEFGDPVWVKEIRTTSHNNRDVHLRDLVSDDPDDPDDVNWRNGEPDEVEVEWQLLQTDFNKADGGANGELAAAPEPLENGDEVVTRRYEFFRYIGPIDAETGEALADRVDADGIHGSGIRTIDGEEVDLSTIEVVGDYTGAQMAAIDVDATVGLIEQVASGSVGEPYQDRRVIIPGATPFTATVTGAQPPGMTLDAVTGILSGTPAAAGTWRFTVRVSDAVIEPKEKTYTLLVAAAGEELPPHCLLDITTAPAGAGSVTGNGSYAPDALAAVTASPRPGFRFLHWENAGRIVATDPATTVTMTVNASLVARFAADVARWSVTAAVQPAEGGSVAGTGTFDDGTSVTLTASANPGWSFVNWTEGPVVLGTNPTLAFTATADRSLTANFTAVPTWTITTAASPPDGGTITGGGAWPKDSLVTLTATALPGYTFSAWTQNGTIVSTAPSWSFNATADRSLVAVFTPVGAMRTITTASSPSAGGTTTGGGSYAIGALCTVTATSAADYLFKRWLENGVTVSSSATWSFTVAGERTLTARFARIYPVTTAVDPPGSGTATVSGSFEDGDRVTVTATANPGYTFSGWIEDGALVSAETVYSFKANPSRHLVARFSGGSNEWPVTALVSPTEGGTVTGAGNHADGTVVDLAAQPSPGYQFVGWTENGTPVATSPILSFTADRARTLTAVFALLPAGIRFDFDTSTIHATPGALLPLSQMHAGITADFTAPAGSGFMIGAAPGLSGFSGRSLVPAGQGTALNVQFDRLLAGASVRFAIPSPAAPAAPVNVRVIATNSTATPPAEAARIIVSATIAPGDALPGGTAVLDGVPPFDQLVIELVEPAAPGTSLACDNLIVTPHDDGSGLVTLANPDWNITLSDFGYSDYLVDDTPGFEGREYLSGEWGAAVAYTRGSTTRSPRWLEPNFLFPDWQTNSDFRVIVPATLVAANADGLPVARSVIANGELEITIRSEMLDSVTGVPMGISPASAGGAGGAITSNRYVLSQSYTVRNISGQPVSGLQLFQLLHGFSSQHGTWDDRLYPGRFSAFRHDVTLAGVDATTAGVAGSSAGGLEDFIGFSTSIAPSAFEIGHYGIAGVDDHVTGKPSEGVHLSIEDNWTHAPWSDRLGTDNFRPATPWIAGAQRCDLPPLADGQSATVDVMLSILTGTTVTGTTLPGGDDRHPASGSCNGGSLHIGGVDFEIEDVVQNGTFFGEESEADDDELADRIEDGEFVLPAFARPGGLAQVWNLSWSGRHSGRIRLRFNYDPALVPAGTDASRLTIYHFHDGSWEQLVGTVDATRHIITVSVTDLSPFMLGISTPHAIPELVSQRPANGTTRLTWQADTTGWILQENTSLDPAGWHDCPIPAVPSGSGFTVDLVTGPARCFFRLTHP